MKLISSCVWLLLGLAITLTSCNITLQNTMTSGEASDVVDDTDNASPTVSPDISVPAVGL